MALGLGFGLGFGLELELGTLLWTTRNT